MEFFSKTFKLLFIIFLLTACASQERMESQTHTINNVKDANDKFGKNVDVIGIYKQINESPYHWDTLYNGRVAIEMEDKGLVYLGNQKEEIRGNQEIIQFENKKVKVSGMLIERTKYYGDIQETSKAVMRIEDITGIEEIH